MNNMKKNFNGKLKKQVMKIALNTGENALGGRCWGMVYEPELPVELLVKQMKDLKR